MFSARQLDEAASEAPPGVVLSQRHGLKNLASRFLSPGDTEHTVGHSYRQIIHGISTALAGRGIGSLTSLIAVPLTVRYLGGERYGVWITLSSMLGWLLLFDLGIGYTAINGVSEALAYNDYRLARERVNSAYAGMLAIAATIGACIAIGWHWISWPALLGSKAGTNSLEISRAAAIACLIFLANFPLTVTPRILGACKKVTLANYWSSAGSILSLVLIVLATRLHTGLPGLVIAISGATLIANLFSTGWLYLHFEWLTPSLSGIKWDDFKCLVSTSMPFFAVQLSGLILFSTDNVIIAQILGARSVTPYSVTWKLFSYASLLQVVITPSLWPAYADAFARRDLAWIRKTYRYAVKSTFVVTLALVSVLTLAAKPFISIWAGSAAVPPMSLVVAMAFMTLLLAPVWCSSSLLGGSGQVKNQAIYSGIGAVVNIATSIWFGHVFGLTGIVLGTICAYALCIFLPQTFEAERLLSGND